MAQMYPIFLKLAGRPVLVVGGGEIGWRKLESLLPTEAQITLISPMIHPELKLLLDNHPQIVWLPRPYQKNDVHGFSLVIASTSEPQTNQQVYQEAHELGIPVNIVDVPPLCSFYVPATYRSGDLTLAISTDGKAPVMSGIIRRYFETQSFGPIFAEVLAEIAEKRLQVNKLIHLSASERKNILKEYAFAQLKERGLDIQDVIKYE